MKIIAEAAMNHFGSAFLMWGSIEKAIEAGADYVKFQLIDEKLLYAPGQYEYGNYEIDNVRWTRRVSRVANEDYSEVSAMATRKYGRPVVTATPFDLPALDTLISTNPPFIKIASGDNNYRDLLDEASKSGFKIILSTGMSSTQQIDTAVDAILRHTSDLVLMHCVAEYPHDAGSAMLGEIDRLKSRYGVEIGYSDHSVGYAAAVVAATLGVRWFEKHFTIARANGGLDAKHSLEADELKEYCDVLKSTQTMFSTRKDVLGAAESYVARRARRGVYFASRLPVGHLVRREDLLFLRPQGDIALEQVDAVIGKKLKRDVESHTPVSMNDIDCG